MNRVFVDVDIAIEHRTGLTIPRIFADYSEPFFRAIEKGICHELMLEEHLVIATGGGAIIDDDTRREMQKHGFLVCLTASLDAIETRLRNFDMRPLAGEWRKHYEERQSIYEALPRCVDTTDKTPQQVTQEVLALWQNESS
jgi:shikimate kinase